MDRRALFRMASENDSYMRRKGGEDGGGGGDGRVESSFKKKKKMKLGSKFNSCKNGDLCTCNENTSTCMCQYKQLPQQLEKSEGAFIQLR